MSSPQNSAGQFANVAFGRIAQQAYDLGLPAGKRYSALLNQMVDSGGMRPEIQKGQKLMEGLSQDRAAGEAGQAARAMREQSQGMSGNLAMQLDPNMAAKDIGMFGVGRPVREGMSALEQQSNAIAQLFGLAGSAGNQQMQAGQNMLQAASMRDRQPGLLQGLATAGAAAYGGWGAYQQQKQQNGSWFGAGRGSYSPSVVGNTPYTQFYAPGSK